MIMQLDFHRKQKLKHEARGDTTSAEYKIHVEQIKDLEAEIGDYEGEGIDYDRCMDVPKEISKALKKKNKMMKKVIKWLGSPVDKKKLSARDPGHLNSTLVHVAVYAANSDLLSILLQHGADVNASDAKGTTPLMITTQTCLEQAKLLLEWGAEISFCRSVLQSGSKNDKDAFIQFVIRNGNNAQLATLVSSEFGGRRCEVINLPNHPQLNGMTCVVEKYITKKDKYKIIFEGSGNAALVGPNNLKRRDRSPLDCGYYILFKNGKVSRRDFATKEECQTYVASLDSSSGDAEGTAEELSSLKL